MRFLKSFMMIAVLGLLAVPSVSHAKSMESLVQDGFKVSKLTRGKSGLAGWYLTKEDQKYFCPIRVALVYVDSKKMIGLSTQGSQIILDRATFDAHIGGPDPTIPYWKDVVVGNVKPQHVNPCLPSK
ncbi:hypothetical protein [Pleomorphomonas oryzae]|uniref:hypothetical protein n=1 Tax=Pleomorphomonas oryzae TaxID=261934 RepID=UPI0003FB9B8E|nr:hypothetical protein [Pleomorphomonas oryzae]